jgi:hypothetical protein
MCAGREARILQGNLDSPCIRRESCLLRRLHASFQEARRAVAADFRSFQGRLRGESQFPMRSTEAKDTNFEK